MPPSSQKLQWSKIFQDCLAGFILAGFLGSPPTQLRTSTVAATPLESENAALKCGGGFLATGSDDCLARASVNDRGPAEPIISPRPKHLEQFSFAPPHEHDFPISHLYTPGLCSTRVENSFKVFHWEAARAGGPHLACRPMRCPVS